MADAEFQFQDPGELVDGDLRLLLVTKQAADPRRGWVPAYTFIMRHVETDLSMGNIQLRVSDSYFIRMYAGQIGYSVDPNFRGQRYAARACALILPLARAHGIEPLWITCNPDNLASRRTCERLGCELVEIVDVPAYTFLYQRGDRQKCRYRLSLADVPVPAPSPSA